MKPGREAADGCILLFVKSPEHAPVKSRLARSIGKERARELYKNFVLDILETLSDVTAKAGYALRVYVYPPAIKTVESIRKWLGDDYAYLPQQGDDLGERMKNAFLATFAEGYMRVVVIGSDAPDLTDEIITEGVHRLEHGDAVLGPAHDGGYYLIGFRSGAFLPAVFEDIRWGTGEVFAATTKIFQQAHCDVSVLPPWRDMDTLPDLQDFRARHEKSSFADSRTMRYLRSWDRE